MAASDARPVPRKNVALRVTFPIHDTSGNLVSGATGLDSEVSKDAAAFADCTNEAAEIGSSGIYTLDVTADEMNADTVAVQVKTSTAGATTTVLVLYPEEAGDYRCDVVQISGDGTAADNCEAWFDGTGYTNISNVIGITLVASTIGSGGISASSFGAGALNAAALATDAAQEIADALLDRANGVETGYTPRQALRLVLAALAGKLSGAGGTSIAIRDVNDAKDRITATVDASGNRQAVSYDVS